MAVDKKLLKRLKALYVEDDDSIRKELSGLLGNFFGKVYSAQNGKVGLEMYLENRDDIDVVLSDINMPEMTGIEMMNKIREVDSKLPVMFATAYSDNEFLSEAIKLRVYDYIIKPIDIRNLLAVMNDLANILYQDFLIEQQHKELEKYKDVIDQNNIVIKTDMEGKITYVNKLFVETTGFELEELSGKKLYDLKHKESPDSLYDEIDKSFKAGEVWSGKLKNITKFGEEYIVDSYTIPTINDSGFITGSMSVQKDITMELAQKRDIQKALMKDKGEIFLKGKESIAELNSIINELNSRIVEYQHHLKQVQMDLAAAERHTFENKRLKTELKAHKKNAEYVEDKNALTLKLNKEVSDLRHHVKILKEENKRLKSETEKGFIQNKVNLEIKIDDLEKELEEARKKIEDIGDAESFGQKLEYWKEKAAEEARRVEQLEREIVNTGDKSIMKKLFG